MNNVHFAIPEIYGDSLSYYELLRKLVDKTNDLIDNYNTVPEQIAEEVKNLDASQLFSTVLNQLIHSIATDNTKSANAVKVYKKHDLLYATFNETVNLYESLIDFTTGAETELITGTNIREVNISELFIELRKLIDTNKNNIEAVTALSNENSAEIATMHNDITGIENKNTEQDNEISTLRTMISTPYNFKGDVDSLSALPASGEVNDTYYVKDVKYKVTWTGSAWVQSSLSEADYQTELTAMDNKIGELKGDLGELKDVLIETINIDFSNPTFVGKYISSSNRMGEYAPFSIVKLDNLVQGDVIKLIATGDGTNVAMISTSKDESWFTIHSLSIDSNEHEYTWTYNGVSPVYLSFNNTKNVSATIERSKIYTSDVIEEKLNEIDVRSNVSILENENNVLPEYMYMFDTIGIVGDSLASGEVYPPTGNIPKDNYKFSWLSSICKKIGATPSHYSKGGMMAKTWYNGDYKTQLLEDTPKNAYYVALGTNDKQYFQIGNITDTETENTFMGWYNTILDTIHSHAPNAVIFCVSLYLNDQKSNSFSNAIKELSENRDYCYYIDFVNNCDDDLIITSTYTNFIHNWHYTGLGYVRVSNVIRKLTDKVINDNLSNFKYFTYNQN